VTDISTTPTARNSARLQFSWFQAHSLVFVRHLMQSLSSLLPKFLVVCLLVVALSSCTAMELAELSSEPPKLTASVVAEMEKKGVRPEDPVLVRIFKQESELEVWKADAVGRYKLFKTYPMCRWSGKLGPKKKEGDRQAPEGFYHVSAGMLNPQSQYYVSFNLGYPNRLEAALGYSGEALMVHGACSSSGCYAMTDQGVGEIYAIVQTALQSGQDRFQVQAYPFRMTAENFARHRGDPNMPFWLTLKEGYDYFAFSKRQPKVAACDRRYVFNKDFEGGDPRSPLAACPTSTSMASADLQAMMAVEREKVDAALGIEASSSALAYIDGGMHPSFRVLLKKQGAAKLAEDISITKYSVSRPEAALADPYSGKSAVTNGAANE
jgi:murein L,D-transpeptidase YafK